MNARLRYVVLAAISTVALCGTSSAVLAAAGKLVYAFGDVRVVDISGVTRSAHRGTEIGSGETVTTGQGRAQIRFTDGGFAALQPNTEYRLDEYRFEGKADSAARNFLSLVRGTVRLVTGAIGKQNQGVFRLRTTVATIGIRGTEGVIQHCQGDCADKDNGTYLRGYGGTWTLETSSYKGLVESGESYHCTGGDGGCSKMEGPSGSREDVNTIVVETAEENVAQQGNQTGSNGRQCDLGGTCGGQETLLAQLGALIVHEQDSGDVDLGQRGLGPVIVFTNQGVPFANLTVISQSYTDPDPQFSYSSSNLNLDTIDFDSLRSAVQGLADPVLRAQALEALDNAAAEKLAALRANPASVDPADFGLTRDGVLTKGRIVDGHMLRLARFEETDIDGTTLEFESELLDLIGNQASHFIFGPDPGPITFGGVGSYEFSGGTRSTNLSGAALGMGVTSGRLLWNFGLNIGELAMRVDHAGVVYDMNSLLYAADESAGVNSIYSEQFFFQDFQSGTASSTVGTFDIYVDGFFAGPNGDGPPRAAGLDYVIYTDDPIIGVAAFGLGANQSGLIHLPGGSGLAWTHAFTDPFSADLNSNGGSVAPFYGTLGNDEVVISANGALQSFLGFTDALGACSGSGCTAEVGSGGISGRGRNDQFRVEWGRLDPPYSMTIGGMAATPRGPLHYIFSTNHSFADFPLSGVMVYDSIIGGTAPTRTLPDGTSVTGSHSVSMTIDYGTSELTAFNVSGSFPGGASYQFVTGGSRPVGSGLIDATVTFGGGDTVNVVDPACGGPCVMFGAGVGLQVLNTAGAVIGNYGTMVFDASIHPVSAINGNFLVAP